MAENTKERLQFDFSPEALKRLDEMKEKAKARSRAEVVREGLRLYEWLLTEINPEYTIKVYDKEQLVTSFTARLLFK